MDPLTEAQEILAQLVYDLRPEADNGMRTIEGQVLLESALHKIGIAYLDVCAAIYHEETAAALRRHLPEEERLSS